jgi:hypothetical protein
MAMEEERRELGNINRQSDQMADELGDVIKKFDEQDDQKFKRNKQEIRQHLQILKGKLKGMASNYEPDPESADPTDPNITGKPRDAKPADEKSKEEKLLGEQREQQEQQLKATQAENKARGDEGKNQALATDQEKKNQPAPDATRPWERPTDPANPANLGRENEFDPTNKDVVENNLKEAGGNLPGASGQGASTADPTNNPFHQK